MSGGGADFRQHFVDQGIFRELSEGRIQALQQLDEGFIVAADESDEHLWSPSTVPRQSLSLEKRLRPWSHWDAIG